MSFFKQFPKAEYSINNDGIRNNIIDVFRYVDVRDKLATNIITYQYVDIYDGERPDNLSYRLYGTPDYHWTFFITNDELKGGLGSWPKGDYELESKINNEFENIAIYTFPTRLIQNNNYTTKGLSINNYLGYLKLAYITESLRGDLGDGIYDTNAYSIADIIHYEDITSQIWIDKTTTQFYSPEYGNLYETDEYSSGYSSYKNSILNPPLNTNFRILFVNPYTEGEEGYNEAELLRNKWNEEVRSCIYDARQDPAYDYLQDPTNINYDNIYFWHEFYLHGVWSDGKNAPAYYYNNVTNDVINDFEIYLNQGGDPSSINTFYVSYEEDAVNDNNSRKRIKVVKPSYITQFAREYKNLINE